jgi:archaellum component FlaC
MGLREVERILLTAQRELMVLQGQNPELRKAEGSGICDWINDQLKKIMSEVYGAKDRYMRIRAELEELKEGD